MLNLSRAMALRRSRAMEMKRMTSGEIKDLTRATMRLETNRWLDPTRTDCFFDDDADNCQSHDNFHKTTPLSLDMEMAE